MSDKPRLLWVGDHSVDSGFARISHQVLKYLCTKWEVTVLGINHFGDPVPKYPYDVYPCFTPFHGGDMLGVSRIGKLIMQTSPDVVLLQNDPWLVKEYFPHIPADVPIVASIPVDGKNLKDGVELNRLAAVIFWTQFGIDQARNGGYDGPAIAIPLGVDRRIYYKQDKLKSRQTVLPEVVHESFIVGNVNRNQQRKRLDLTIQYFCEWIKEYKIDDAWLSLHVCPTGDVNGYDVKQLMRYYGYSGKSSRGLFNSPGLFFGVSEADMALLYNCFDVQVSTTQGEGWGLTTLEGMACGVPQLVPQWAALGEWAAPASVQVPCSNNVVTGGEINVIGGVPDKQFFIEQLNELYKNENLRQVYSDKASDLAAEPQFKWSNIASQYQHVLDQVVGARRQQVGL